ncbi:MAG: DUF6186 family protein [Acidimicrobiales bacterium]
MTREGSFIVWAALGFAVVCCVVVSAVRPRWIATFNSSVRGLVSTTWVRVIVVVGWMWLGWHLFAR